MSEKKPKGPAENTPTTEHKSANQEALEQRRKKSFIRLMIVAGALILVSIATYFIFTQANIFNGAEELEKTTVDKMDDAFAYEAEGDIENSLSVYRKLIDQEDENAEKAVYYLEKARIAQRAEDIELARMFTEQSLKLDETSIALQLMAVLLESDQRQEEAIEYYKRALELLRQHDEVERESIDFIEEQINRLNEEAA